MTKAESYLDFLRMNLADVFRRFFLIKHHQTPPDRTPSTNQHLPSINVVKKARINMTKYGYLFDTVGSEEVIVNLQSNENKFKKKKRTKSKKNTKKQPSEIIIVPPSASVISQPSVLSKTDDYQPHEIPDHCRKKMNRLYNMQPKINVHTPDPLHLLDSFKHHQTKETSVLLQAEQLFRCPKDSRSRRQKCCGVYYELFDDAWQLLIRWFANE